MLGRGATATVYQALCYQTHQKVAVKVIQKKFVRSERLLLNEINTHRAADHPNILRLLDTFEDDKMLYLVTELCQSGDLQDHIFSEASEDEAVLAMLEEDALHLFQQMVSSVHYLHRRGLVHRDLKPANFLRDVSSRRGKASEPLAKSFILKLCDFGVASYSGYEKHLLTQKIGSDGYMAPEVIRRRPYNEKADIFSLGCILHTMLTGSAPQYQNGSHNVNETRLQFASEEVRELVRSLLQHRPEDRPSAESLINLSLVRPSSSQLWSASGAPAKELLDKMCAYSSFPLLKRAALLAMVSQASSDADFLPLTDTFISMCSPRSTNCRARPGIALADVYESLLKERDAVQPGLSGCRRAKRQMQPGDRRALNRFCQSLGLRGDLERLIYSIDASGTISYSEWLAATVDSSWYMDPKRIAATFSFFDQDQDGLISEEDLKRALPDVFDLLPVDVVLKGAQLSASSWMNQEQFSLLIHSQSTSLSCANWE